MTATDADEVFKVIFCGKHRAGGDADIFCKGALMQLERIAIPGQFHPEDKSPRRPGNSGAAWKIFCNCLADPLHLLLISTTDLAQMMIVSTVPDELRNRKLWQCRGGKCVGEF